jgi:hypothetical protein
MAENLSEYAEAAKKILNFACFVIKLHGIDPQNPPEEWDEKDYYHLMSLFSHYVGQHTREVENKRVVKMLQQLKEKLNDAPLFFLAGAQCVGSKDSNGKIIKYTGNPVPEELFLQNGKYWAWMDSEIEFLIDDILEGKAYDDEE